jgi:hypothetical protein
MNPLEGSCDVIYVGAVTVQISETAKYEQKKGEGIVNRLISLSSLTLQRRKIYNKPFKN